MEEKLYSVYMHENKLNGKKYIGITSRDPEIRWRKGTEYKTCTAMNRAFQKYGWDGFNHIVLATGLTKEEACSEEIRLIRELNTRDPNYGYNICVGGVGTSGSPVSDEERRKRSERWKGEKNPNYQGKAWTPEYREHMRQVNLGKKLTDEHKRKIGNSLRGRKHVSENGKKHIAETHSRPVIRDDGVVFKSVTEAAKSIGRTDTAIVNAIKRGHRSGKHYWKYAESNA